MNLFLLTWRKWKLSRNFCFLNFACCGAHFVSCFISFFELDFDSNRWKLFRVILSPSSGQNRWNTEDKMTEGPIVYNL